MSVQNFKSCVCPDAATSAYYGIEQQPTCSIAVFYAPLTTKLNYPILMNAYGKRKTC